MSILTTVILTASMLTSGGSNGICAALDDNPTPAGVAVVVSELIAAGYDADNGGPEILVGTVVSECPEHLRTLQRFIDTYGG